MMNTSLIAVLAALVLILFLFFLKKSSGGKPPVEDVTEEEVPPQVDDVTAEEVAEVSDSPSEETDSTVEGALLEEELVLPEEEESIAGETVDELELDDDEAITPLEEVDLDEDIDKVDELIIEEPEDEKKIIAEPATEETPVVTISLESYEQQLTDHKKQRMAALTEAIAQNQETRREQLQSELVAITETLSFLEQSYDQDIACRKNALALLCDVKAELSNTDYERARSSLCEGETEDAEQVFAEIAEKNGSSAAQAAYQNGCLAEKRMDLQNAMKGFEKAIELDGDQPDFYRSAGLLARRLYAHTKALRWFTALAGLLGQKDEDTLELALARREQAYSSALVGKHKQAGGLYKQAMVSLMKLVGKDHLEMGISWLQIGKLQESIGQYEKAEDPYLKALVILEKDETNPVLGDNLDKLAGLYMELERERDAIPLLERLCVYKEQSANPDMASLTMAYSNLAEACRICGNYEESEKNYQKALTMTEDLRGKEHAAVGSILQELVQLCERQGKKEEAEVHRERAAKIFQRVLEEQEAKGQEAKNLSL